MSQSGVEPMTEDEAYAQWLVVHDAHREGRKAEALAMWQEIKDRYADRPQILRRAIAWRFQRARPTEVLP